MRNRFLPVLISLVLPGVLSLTAASAAPGRYLEPEAFLQEVFDRVPETSSALTLNADLRERIEAVLEHRFTRLRVRYWCDGVTSAWVLDEIGKTEPITVGIAIRAGQVERVRILEFRESRGDEVRYPFFTDRFTGASLARDLALDRAIDGITGATLSVAAVSKLVRVALLLDATVASRHAGSHP